MNDDLLAVAAGVTDPIARRRPDLTTMVLGAVGITVWVTLPTRWFGACVYPDVPPGRLEAHVERPNAKRMFPTSFPLEDPDCFDRLLNYLDQHLPATGT